ncbi:hypothetical protein H072_11424 [Dactylellina haptotyla CBS 200.50]|uniref:Rhodopsin domain-containing protein n=1 Tax=Dactylellina haptotyla (strain CBS 200.50) TaxID=1284197 RepID=S8B830_DACHA|nr:hypothetical protein H072_11424 [Dactylellina haptotyla CBS 200.50]
MYLPKTLDEALLLAQIVEKINGAAVFKSIPASATSKDYVPPDRGTLVFVVAVVSMAVALILVVMRLYTRKIYAGTLGTDDWMIIPATVVTMGFTTIQILGVKSAHMGMHVYDISPYAMIEGTKLTYAHMILYCYSIMFTKLSIILFIRKLSSGTMWHPIAAAFDLLTKLEHKCNGLTMYYALTSIGVVSDIAILALPIPIVLKLQLPVYKKLAVLFLFSLGGLACVFAILRMINLFDGVKGIDLTWDIVPVALYGQLEVTLAIIATSLPALKVLWKGWLPRFSVSAEWKTKRSNPSDRSGASSGGRTRQGSLAKMGTISSVTDKKALDGNMEIELGGSILWRNVEFGKGIPAEEANNADDQSRDWRRENGTPLSVAEGALLDDRIYPVGLSPSVNRSRQNSRATSDVSAESDISLGNWVAVRNNSFAIGTPLSPMPQPPPQAQYDRPRKDSEIVVRW